MRATVTKPYRTAIAEWTRVPQTDKENGGRFLAKILWTKPRGTKPALSSTAAFEYNGERRYLYTPYCPRFTQGRCLY